MEGSIAPLREITEICKKNSVQLLVDEAHAIGILGPEGRGLSFNCRSDITIITGTFGKAFGSGGAFIASNSEIGEYLIQTSGAFRYTTALAPSLAAGALEGLKKILVFQFREILTFYQLLLAKKRRQFIYKNISKKMGF